MTEPALDREKVAPANGDTPTTQVIRLVVVAFVAVGCFLVLRPFLSALMWAIILCLSSWPLYARLVKLFGGRRTLAAAVMTLATVLVLLAPFVAMGIGLADDVARFSHGVQRVLSTPPPGPPQWVEQLPLVGPRIRAVWEGVLNGSIRLLTSLKWLLAPTAALLVDAGAGFAGGLAQLALSIFLGFFLFRDGPTAARRLVETTEQLAGHQARPLIQVASNTVRGVVYGILGTALAQAVVAGTGFVIAGVPGAGLLALLTFFLSIVPVGPPLIWIPVTMWLFGTGHAGWGVFMICWGLLVSSVDNVIKPLIIGYSSPMPFILILLGVLGGVMAFGFVGVFLGPTLLVVGVRLLDAWSAARAASSDAAAGTP